MEAAITSDRGAFGAPLLSTLEPVASLAPLALPAQSVAPSELPQSSPVDSVALFSDPTLFGDPAALFDFGSDGLSALLGELGQDLGAASPAGSSQAFGASLSASSSFSFSLAFSGFASRMGHGRGAFKSLFGSLDQAFQQLAGLDAKQSERLSLLAQLLAALDPEGSDRMLQSLYDTLTSFNKNFASNPANGMARLDVPGQGNGPPTQAQRDGGGQMLHFELDFEVEFSSSVEATVAQLRENGIDVSTTRIESTQRFEMHIEFTGTRQQMRRSDPLVLDLGGDGVALSGLDDGADFDIDGDGTVDRTAFVQGDDAFLALDRNGNGSIDDGSELFGDQNGARNGFEELRRYDENSDGRIDKKDAIFKELRLLQNSGGRSKLDMRALSTLLERGIESLDLGYGSDKSEEDAHGNILAERSTYGKANGQRGSLIDAWVGYSD